MANATESAAIATPEQNRPQRVTIYGRDSSDGTLRPISVGTDGQLQLNLTGEGLALDVSVDGIETLLTAAQSTSLTPSNTASANQDQTQVKASAGTLYQVSGANVASSARYLKIYNVAAPTSASTPRKVHYLPPNQAFVFDYPQGLAFATAIGFRITTGSANNDANAATAGDILALCLDYT